MAFGSMFAKTYRINKIFTYSGTSVVKDKLLKDKQLITLIFALLLIDALIVALWVVTDPMRRHLHNMAPEISRKDRAVVYQPQVGKLVNDREFYFKQGIEVKHFNNFRNYSI